MPAHEHWLNQHRLKVYPRIFLGVFVLVAAAWFFSSKQMVDQAGQPVGDDFITFYSASRLALTGHAADAYSVARIAQVEHAIVTAADKVFAWFYPPAFYVLILPLAKLPYLPAYAAFVSITLGLYVRVFLRVTKSSVAIWCLAAFPGLWVNLVDGQNAFLTAALAAAALICVPRRPLLAGTLIGLLAIKPHLALLFPVALLAVGAWRALASAAATAFALTAAGTIALGETALRAWWASLHVARAFLERGELSYDKMPTFFALARNCGAPVDVAYLVHGLGALAATGAVVSVWRRGPRWDWMLRGAALMSGTFLISPYVFDYDLAWLAFPIVWMALIGVRDGWLPAEREILLAAWLIPFLMAPISGSIGLQPGPLVLAALLWTTVRRARGAANLRPAGRPAAIPAAATDAPQPQTA